MPQTPRGARQKSDKEANRVQAQSECEAVEVFQQKIAAGSPLIDRGDIREESAEELAPTEAVPYPEALPDGPALLAVVELGKSEQITQE